MIQISSQTPNILVIGDLIIDHYLWGSCNRISPEAPVQVVNIQKESMLLGGAGNVVNNLKSLDAKVDIISVIGECDVSSELRKMLLEIKIDIQNLVIQKDRSSKSSDMIKKILMKLIINHKSLLLRFLKEL
jgi:D-beta-D-heptose 7-phosphate kinase/D-beta-D-heptose 1-phosphate adenosyltransferase